MKRDAVFIYDEDSRIVPVLVTEDNCEFDVFIDVDPINADSHDVANCSSWSSVISCK